LNIYLAAGFSAQEELLADIVPLIEARGHRVQAHWLVEPVVTHREPAAEERWWRGLANEDFIDTYTADAVIVYTHWPSSYGGRHVEFGVALARKFTDRNFRLFLVGDKEHLFHYMSAVEYIEGDPVPATGTILDALADGRTLN
jgi:hypothetical protein